MPRVCVKSCSINIYVDINFKVLVTDSVSTRRRYFWRTSVLWSDFLLWENVVPLEIYSWMKNTKWQQLQDPGQSFYAWIEKVKNWLQKRKLRIPLLEFLWSDFLSSVTTMQTCLSPRWWGNTPDGMPSSSSSSSRLRSNSYGTSELWALTTSSLQFWSCFRSPPLCLVQ